MDWRQQLHQLCRQWRALSEAEAEAIRAEQWDRLAAHQERKEALRQSIEEVLASGPGRHASLTPEIIGPELYQGWQDLVAEERRNSAALAEKLRAIRRKIAELDQVQSTLKRVHRAYVPGARHAWQSFS